MLDQVVIDSLSPPTCRNRALKQRYLPRQLDEAADVTRLGPSPTGFVHIGGVYVA